LFIKLLQEKIQFDAIMPFML